MIAQQTDRIDRTARTARPPTATVTHEDIVALAVLQAMGRLRAEMASQGTVLTYDQAREHLHRIARRDPPTRAGLSVLCLVARELSCLGARPMPVGELRRAVLAVLQAGEAGKEAVPCN